MAGVEYGREAKADISLRVVTDHIRSATFMIGPFKIILDGIRHRI